MSDEPEDEVAAIPAKRRSKLIPIAAVLALLTGGGAFYAVYSGLVDLPLPGGGRSPVAQHGAEPERGDGDLAKARHPGAAAAYVALDPMVISLGPQSRARHLKVVLVVETGLGREAEVEMVRPRIVDMLNVFLRAVDEREFELPRAMERMRAQMLRRVQLVAPEGAVLDLLVQEFILN